MGFFDVLGKVANGTIDFVAELGQANAKRIDEMTDQEIQNKFPNSSIYEVRNQASTAHELYERRQSRKNNYGDYCDDYDD